MSYIIWFSPRTGSSVLCKGLEATGIAGKPGEYMNTPNEAPFEDHYGTSTYEELKSRLWELGCSENGVMGIKYSIYRSLHQTLGEEVKRFRDLPNAHILDWQLWEEIFPNCKHIFLTRRNKIRQAVSWWKAIQDSQWHRQAEEEHREEAGFYADKYNFDALMHLFQEASLREAATQAFFTHNQIQALTMVYEDVMADFEGSIGQIVRYLELGTTGLPVKKPYYQKTANEISERWVQRFREELQQNWDPPRW